MDRIDRRHLLAMAGGAALLPLLPTRAFAADAFVMWRDPGCGCCLEWAKRMEAAFGRPMTIVAAPDMRAIKRARGVPDDLQSCHTALVGAFSIEGHVPPADVKRLLAARPAGVRGIAAPGMPMGAPGMEHGDHRQPYDVVAFGPGGRSTFASH
ncbi:MAG TPA: DUF411 domain-containing protein [Allosphingosinicella sp.]